MNNNRDLTERIRFEMIAVKCKTGSILTLIFAHFWVFFSFYRVKMCQHEYSENGVLEMINQCIVCIAPFALMVVNMK